LQISKLTGKLSSDGIRKLRLTSFSSTLDNIGRTEIGLKSEARVGFGIFGIGCIIADFHSAGKVEQFSDKLKMCAKGAAKNAAHSLRNQNGSLSKPDAVGFNLLSILSSSSSSSAFQVRYPCGYYNPIQ
jgi:hypothetical protein